MLELLWEVLKETTLDTLKVIPILFIAYGAMELIEHKAGERTKELVKKSGHFGPLYGAVLGILPQCGFSAGASSLYAGRVITVGTLVAVYLSTSDEMLPILLSENVPAGTIGKILGLKVLFAILAGFAIDFGVRLFRKRRHVPLEEEPDIHHVCEHDAAHKEEDGILKSTILHTVKITGYLFLISFALTFLMELIGEERLSSLLVSVPVLSEMVAGLIGLIPNCAASVVITQLYVEGLIGAGPMMSGLLVGAGIGILVLFKEHDNPKKNFAIVGMTYFFGVLFGVLLDLLNVTL